MKRTWLYRWFGVGKMPADARARLGAPLLLEEGVSMVLRRSFRAPRRIMIRGIRLESCAFGLTRTRVAIAFRGVVVEGEIGVEGGGPSRRRSWRTFHPARRSPSRPAIG